MKLADDPLAALMAAAMAAIWAASEAATPHSIEVKNFMFTPTTLDCEMRAQRFRG